MKQIPVLCFHKISNRFEWGLTTYTPERFEHLISILIGENFYFCLPDTVDPDKKNIILTFDDGYANVYRHAFPILKKRRIPFIVFPIINYIGKPNLWDVNIGGVCFNHLDLHQLKAMKKSGAVIGSHGLRHRAFSLLSPQQQRDEIEKSFAFLEKAFATDTRFFSPPFGETILDKNCLAKFDYNFILDNKYWDGQSKEISRIPVYRYETPGMVLKKILNPGFNSWIAKKIHLGAKASVWWQKYMR